MRGIKLPHGLKPEGLGVLPRRSPTGRRREQASAASLAQSPVQSIMKIKKVKFYATLRGEGLIAALPHTPSC